MLTSSRVRTSRELTLRQNRPFRRLMSGRSPPTFRPVETYLAELYVPDRGERARAPLAARVNAAAEELAREGIPVCFVRSVFVPRDETCFCIFEAQSADLVREALVRAALDADNVVEAYVLPA